MKICERCGGKPVVASCCTHLARGLATFDTQLVCTHCGAKAARHPLCAACVEVVRKHNVPVADRKRAFGLVERAPYLRILSIDRPKLCAIGVGDFVKIGLSKVPLVEPRWLESLWVKIDRREGQRLRGAVENDPDLFTPKQLARGQVIEFSVDNVVDVMPAEELTEQPHECALCRGEGRELDAGDEKLLSDVRSLGLHVLQVPGDEEGPPFAFTVGLHHRFAHPEVIVVGLDIHTAQRVLNRLGCAVAAKRKPDLDRLLEATRCSLREPTAPDVRHDYFGYARWFYRGDEFPVRQLMWSGGEVKL